MKVCGCGWTCVILHTYINVFYHCFASLKSFVSHRTVFFASAGEGEGEQVDRRRPFRGQRRPRRPYRGPRRVENRDSINERQEGDEVSCLGLEVL